MLNQYLNSFEKKHKEKPFRDHTLIYHLKKGNGTRKKRYSIGPIKYTFLKENSRVWTVKSNLLKSYIEGNEIRHDMILLKALLIVNQMHEDETWKQMYKSCKSSIMSLICQAKITAVTVKGLPRLFFFFSN